MCGVHSVGTSTTYHDQAINDYLLLMNPTSDTVTSSYTNDTNVPYKHYQRTGSDKVPTTLDWYTSTVQRTYIGIRHACWYDYQCDVTFMGQYVSILYTYPSMLCLPRNQKSDVTTYKIQLVSCSQLLNLYPVTTPLHCTMVFGTLGH
jgi:hypothetical protein